MNNVIKVLVVLSIVVTGSSAFAQGPGDRAAITGAALGSSLAAKHAANDTVKITGVEIAGKINDAPNYKVDGYIFYSVQGKTLQCAIDNEELTVGQKVELCDDGRSHYPVIVVKADTKESRLYVSIYDNGILYDSEQASTSKSLGKGYTPVAIEQEENWAGAKLEGGVF